MTTYVIDLSGDDGKFIKYSEAEQTPLDILRLAADRRIDMIMIGDSNQAHSGFGWDHGVQYALENTFGAYATGLLFNGGSGLGVGYNYSTAADTLATAGAPDGVAKYATGQSPSRYGYLESGTYTGGNGIILLSASSIDVNSALRFHFCYHTFATGSGSFKPGVRLENSPYSVIQMGNVISTNTGIDGVALTSVDIPAGTRNVNVSGKYTIPGQTPITGPFAAHYTRIERPDRTAGVSVHTAYGVGGAGLYAMASDMLAAPDESIALMLAETRRLQAANGDSPKVVVWINSGVNDRNQTTQPSLGPGAFTDPDGADAYVDNLTALVSRIEEVYAGQGWDISELYWLIVPSHPVSDPDDAELQAYRVAAEAWAAARDRAQVFDFSDYITSAAMLSGGYYQAGGADKNHLTQAGYEALSSILAGRVPIGTWQNYDSGVDQVAMPKLSRHYEIKDGPGATHLADSNGADATGAELFNVDESDWDRSKT